MRCSIPMSDVALPHYQSFMRYLGGQRSILSSGALAVRGMKRSVPSVRWRMGERTMPLYESLVAKFCRTVIGCICSAEDVEIRV